MPQKYLYLALVKVKGDRNPPIHLADGEEYNRAAIAFDNNLQDMYSLARPRYRTPKYARLKHVTKADFTRNYRDAGVPVRLYRVPITADKLDNLKDMFLSIIVGGGWIYNPMLSATFPIFHGVCNYTTMEFAAQCLRYAEAELARPIDELKVIELMNALEVYSIYTGVISGFTTLATSKPSRQSVSAVAAVAGAGVATVGAAVYAIVRRKRTHNKV